MRRSAEIGYPKTKWIDVASNAYASSVERRAIWLASTEKVRATPAEGVEEAIEESVEDCMLRAEEPHEDNCML
jgi:hypothetical protein